MSDEKLNSMDADIKSLQTEVTRLVLSQDKQTEALGKSTEMMARVCERLEHSAKASDRAHQRCDKLEEGLAKEREDRIVEQAEIKQSVQNNVMTKEKFVGYLVIAGISLSGLMYGIQRIIT